MTVIDRSPIRGGTNEDGEGSDATLRQENAVHESDHADVDSPISDRLYVFIHALVARTYPTPEGTGVSPASVYTVANIESERRTTQHINANGDPTFVSGEPTAKMAMTRSQSAELFHHQECQRQQQKNQETFGFKLIRSRKREQSGTDCFHWASSPRMSSRF